MEVCRALLHSIALCDVSTCRLKRDSNLLTPLFTNHFPLQAKMWDWDAIDADYFTASPNGQQSAAAPVPAPAPPILQTHSQAHRPTNTAGNVLSSCLPHPSSLFCIAFPWTSFVPLFLPWCNFIYLSHPTSPLLLFLIYLPFPSLSLFLLPSFSPLIPSLSFSLLHIPPAVAGAGDSDFITSSNKGAPAGTLFNSARGSRNDEEEDDGAGPGYTANGK